MLPVSILVIASKPNETTEKAIKVLKNQNYKGRKEIILVSEPLGLSENINFGIKKAKYDIIVTLHHDCIPSSLSWLANLVSPLEREEIVAATSKVKLPNNVWNGLNIFTKALMLKEKGTIAPMLDEKGCAYKKQVLKQIGFFDKEGRFKIAGEDFDTYIKLNKIGKIEYPDATVLHYHPSTLNARMRKEGLIWGMGDGANLRAHGKYFPGWKYRLIKSLPLLGLIILILRFPFKKGIMLYPIYLTLIPALHILYVNGFWRGFLTGKQTI